MRVLIVEDDKALRESLATSLRSAGYTVDEAADAAEGSYYINEFAITIAIVDLGLPDRSGAELIEDWRNSGVKIPVLILTARDHWQDKVDGLNAGADDYVVKPFNFDELNARMAALLRRAAGHAQSVIHNGPLQLDARSQAVLMHGNPVTLTAYEYRVLETMVMRVGEVISKAELTDQLYDQEFERDSNVIEVLITRLRKKLDPEREIGLIETLRGRGYRMLKFDGDDETDA